MAHAAVRVVGLLRELASARTLGARARVLREGARIVRELDPEARRQLAVDIATKAAPGLLPKLQERTGVGLGTDQVVTIVEMLGQMSADEIDELAADLSDPSRRRGLAAQVLEATVDPVLDDDVSDEGELVRVITDVPPVVEEPVDAAPAEEAPVEEAPVEEAPVEEELVEEAPVEEEPAAEPETPVPAAPTVVDVEPAPEPEPPPPPPSWRPAEMPSELFRFEDVRPDDHEHSWFGGADLGIAPVEPTESGLAERLLAVEGAGRRLRLVRDELDTFRALPTDEQRAVLLALPDGWVRRRALEALVREDGVSVSAAPRHLETLGRDLDRAWVAATMVEEGLVSLDDLPDLDRLVGARGADRLRQRYAPAAEKA